VFATMFTHEVTQQNQLMVVIMGGDGSLGQTIRELRKTAIIDEHINKITFCLLPFGTGNDTGQVFGWGSNYHLFD
jgi:diacylglycerol kinase family enzyme